MTDITPDAAREIERELRTNSECLRATRTIDVELEAELCDKAADALDAMARDAERWPLSADGHRLATGDTVYWIVDGDSDYWDTPVGEPLMQKIRSITIGLDVAEYRGTHTIVGDELECGNLELYASQNAAIDAAKERCNG